MIKGTGNERDGGALAGTNALTNFVSGAYVATPAPEASALLALGAY